MPSFIFPSLRHWSVLQSCVLPLCVQNLFTGHNRHHHQIVRFVDILGNTLLSSDFLRVSLQRDAFKDTHGWADFATFGSNYFPPITSFFYANWLTQLHMSHKHDMWYNSLIELSARNEQAYFPNILCPFPCMMCVLADKLPDPCEESRCRCFGQDDTPRQLPFTDWLTQLWPQD